MSFPITPYKIKKGFLYWKHFGTREFINRLMDRMEPEDVPYEPWFQSHRAGDAQLMRQKEQAADTDPLVSILVPAFHTPTRFLEELIDSVEAQSYQNWELVIADAGAADDEKDGEQSVRSVMAKREKKDPRVRYVPLADNFGIAENTNRAIAAARGTYIGFLDHDDLLEPDALFEMMKAARERGADMLYSDEDKISADGSKHFQPHFKPEFNLDLLRSNNYITHFLVVKKALAEEALLAHESVSAHLDGVQAVQLRELHQDVSLEIVDPLPQGIYVHLHLLGPMDAVHVDGARREIGEQVNLALLGGSGYANRRKKKKG